MTEKATDNIYSIDDMLTPEQAAERLGVKVGALSLHRVRKTGPAFYKVGKYIRYTLADISAYIQSKRKVA